MREAVVIYRALADERPSVHRPALVPALNDRGLREWTERGKIRCSTQLEFLPLQLANREAKPGDGAPVLPADRLQADAPLQTGVPELSAAFWSPSTLTPSPCHGVTPAYAISARPLTSLI